jgi:hypothetical protein
MKKKKSFLNMDERSRQIAHRIMAIMYLLTIISLQIIVLYRQFGLGQEIDQFEDIAIVMTVNSLFLISALFYFGAIPVQKIRIKTILVAYFAIVILGSLFTYFKYNVFQDLNLSPEEMFGKIKIVIAVTGLIVLFFTLFSYLGKRKMESELED